MSNKYNAVIFDLDGTLLDTTEGVTAAVEYAVSSLGLAPLKEEVLLSFIGPPVQESFHRIYGIEGEQLQELTTVFRNRYKDYELFKAKPYEGIYRTLEVMEKQGIDTSVATYKRQDYAEAILNHFGLDRYMRVIYGADHENKLKKVDIIQKCIISMGIINNGQAVMVGDSSYDAQGAEQVGVDFLGVTYGFGFQSKSDVLKYNAVGCAALPEEILPFIL